MSIINPDKERDLKVSAFYNVITSWLLPLGFTEVYKNHPNISPRIFHFIKNKIRVVCTNESVHDQCYCTLYVDIMSTQPMFALQTTTLIKIGDTETLTEHFEIMRRAHKACRRAAGDKLKANNI